MNDSLPNWTEVTQVIIGTLGVLATVITLWKLMSKDKQRESEIASLSSIASQLKDMLELNEKRYIESKKPHIEIELKRDMHYFLHFKNTNSNSQITQFKRENLEGPNSGMVSKISNLGHNQFFSFSAHGVSIDKVMKIQMTYIVEETYTFKQLVSIHAEGMKIVVRGGIISLENNPE